MKLAAANTAAASFIPTLSSADQLSQELFHSRRAPPIVSASVKAKLPLPICRISDSLPAAMVSPRSSRNVPLDWTHITVMV